MDREEEGRFFRAAWIAGVTTHFPGTPKSGYITPWNEMQEWEQQAAIATYGKTHAFLLAGLQSEEPGHPTSEQGGRFIAEAWNVQVYRHIPDPKPGYVADWDDLPEWQRKTDMFIYSAIEAKVHQQKSN